MEAEGLAENSCVKVAEAVSRVDEEMVVVMVVKVRKNKRALRSLKETRSKPKRGRNLELGPFELLKRHQRR